jgi:hypothetical protein
MLVQHAKTTQPPRKHKPFFCLSSMSASSQRNLDVALEPFAALPPLAGLFRGWGPPDFGLWDSLEMVRVGISNSTIPINADELESMVTICLECR